MKAHEYMLYNDADPRKTWDAILDGQPAAVSAYSPMRCDRLRQLAPPGQSTLTLTTVLPWTPRQRDWRTDKAAIAKDMIALVADRLVPDLADQIEVQSILTPEDLRAFSYVTDGAMYGWENSQEQSLGKRLDYQHGHFRNLNQVGHWTQPGSGIGTVIVSGVQLAEKLMQE